MKKKYGFVFLGIFFVSSNYTKLFSLVGAAKRSFFNSGK